MSMSFQSSSFQKRSKLGVSNIAGTKISASNNTLHASTGIHSLDAITDGGFPVGSLCIIEEDSYGSYTKMLTKYFLAEGLNKQNFIYVASKNENPWDMLNSLPSPVVDTKETTQTSNKEELKIAWRYENLSLEDSTTDSVNTYDLSVSFTLTEKEKLNIHVWDGTNLGKSDQHKGLVTSEELLDLLRDVQNVIEKRNLSSTLPRNILRVVISSFGSPFWRTSADSKEYLATLLVLKSLVRSANVVAVVTLPHQLLSELFVDRAKSLADVVIRLKSLREDPKLRDLMDVHGILEMKKFANLTSLKPLLGQDGTTSYGFKATKRKFKIEKLHLPPSIEAEKQPDKGDSTSLLGCSSGTETSKLDF